MIPPPSAFSRPPLNGLLARIAAESSVTQTRLQTLGQQISSGSIADTFAGLDQNARTTLMLRPVMAAMATWQSNITAANARVDITLTAMDRITAIASDFYARVNNLNGLNITNVDITAAAARDALRELTGLLNTTDGDIYVFGGQDTGNPPVPNCDAILSSGFYTQIAASVAALGGAGASATIAATLAIGGSNAPGTSPFSAYLSQSPAALQGLRPSVEVADLRRQSFGIQASINTTAVSIGTSTTGSYSRDLLRALSTIGSLSSSQIGDAGFAALVEDTRTGLRDAITAMATDAGIIGNDRMRLSAIQDQSEHYLLSITAQVAATEDVDMPAALASLSQVQAQLQASYQMIGSLRELTLVRYLS